MRCRCRCRGLGWVTGWMSRWNGGGLGLGGMYPSWRGGLSAREESTGQRRCLLNERAPFALASRRADSNVRGAPRFPSSTSFLLSFPLLHLLYRLPLTTMPRLQILQHKSYHPYLESNRQRVRDDEAKAAALEAQEERAALDQVSTTLFCHPESCFSSSSYFAESDAP